MKSVTPISEAGVTGVEKPELYPVAPKDSRRPRQRAGYSTVTFRKAVRSPTAEPQPADIQNLL